ncbi:glycosyltransferase family 4 protein [Mycobacteroides abscessus]|uniref:glycosyltransferase family 4 protein n=1 Tax=Mycobacteroides abscessus TaxID=36809 RepID=UPI0039EE432C
MRIAIVAESFLPNVNGVSNSVLRVLEHFRRTGHEAIVIAPDTPRGQAPAATEYAGVPVHRVPAIMFPKVSTLPLGVPQPRMVRIFREFAPDVVHLASPFVLGYGGLRAAQHLDVPVVAVYQTDVAGFADSYGAGFAARAAWRWTKHLHGRADRTLAPSSSAMEDLAMHGIPRVFRWSRGVDIERFAPSARDDELRRAWSPKGKPIIGFVGRLAPEKHVERLAVLAGRDDLQLVIVGGGVEREALEKLMPTAVFTGELTGSALSRAYASLDVFIHPGEHETFCQAVQEALASGVPSIAPDAGGPRDLVIPGRNGMLLPVADFEARLGMAVDHLVQPATRSRFSAAARRGVLARTRPAICDELLEHYAAAAGTTLGRGIMTA